MTSKALFGFCAMIIVGAVGFSNPAYSRSAAEQDFQCLVNFRSAGSIEDVSQDCQRRAPNVVHMLDKQVDQAYDQVHEYQRRLDTECRLDHKDPDAIRKETKQPSFLDGITSKIHL